MEFKRGDVVGSKYWIEQAIGRGGYGTCYHVYDMEENEYGVLKASNNQEAYNREREALTALRNNPGFAHLFCAFSIGRVHYLVMSFEGESALSLLRKNANARFTQKNVIRIGVQIFQLIRQLHYHDFNHGDLHPGNVMLRRDSAGEIQVSLIDFGASKKLPRGCSGNVYRVYDYREAVHLLFVLSGENHCRLDSFYESNLNSNGYPWSRIRDANNRWLGFLSIVVQKQKNKDFDLWAVIRFFGDVLPNFDIGSNMDYKFEHGVLQII